MPDPIKPEPVKPVIPGGKGVIDYSEPPDPAAQAAAQAQKQRDAQTTQVLQEAIRRKEIAEREAIKSQAEKDMLKSQVEALLGTKPGTKELNDEEIEQLYAENPVKASRIIAEQTAKRVRAETVAEMGQQQQQEAVVIDFQRKQQSFAANVSTVLEQNKELADSEHPLSKIYLSLEKEMPWLLQTPDGPLTAIKIAKDRYQLQQLQSGEITPEEIRTAELKGKETEAARQEAAQAATMVSGPSRGVPPSSSIRLTDEQKLAARKMRISPEEYAGYIKNTPAYFKKEEAPKRKSSR